MMINTPHWHIITVAANGTREGRNIEIRERDPITLTAYGRERTWAILGNLNTNCTLMPVLDQIHFDVRTQVV